MKTLVIKCGGSIIDELSDAFFESIKELQSRGWRMVFVHGGGPDINAMLEQSNITPIFENGLRKTTAEVMEIVELVLSGKSNRSLVHKLESHDIKAIGLNGSDGKMLIGSYINESVLGAVGEIEQVDTDLLEMILQKGICPVLTPISITESGQKLNVNADMAAGAVAKALGAQMCLFVTDVKGVLKEGSLLSQLTATETKEMIKEGTIYGGMIPKVTTALSVLEKSIPKVMIVSGKSCFYENNDFIGTKFVTQEGVYQ